MHAASLTKGYGGNPPSGRSVSPPRTGPFFVRTTRGARSAPQGERGCDMCGSAAWARQAPTNPRQIHNPRPPTPPNPAPPKGPRAPVGFGPQRDRHRMEGLTFK
ncbi:hypothetical protein SGFS_045590 [Streptomyces graminofaciens]|uniref:Uncharacterized protein n=1 Tax=Streptomyces graminofaciens TaxID=68212 RepID=A0ABM7FB86_9ACTN|nr:hypothetical protein SGFS_045590 [Streptomyces graminofaciens]